MLGVEWVEVDVVVFFDVVDIDVVYICILNIMYVDFVFWVLNVGKYVICEKLFVMIVEDVWMFVEIVEGCGCVVVVLFIYCYYLMVCEVRVWIV